MQNSKIAWIPRILAITAASCYLLFVLSYVSLYNSARYSILDIWGRDLTNFLLQILPVILIMVGFALVCGKNDKVLGVFSLMNVLVIFYPLITFTLNASAAMIEKYLFSFYFVSFLKIVFWGVMGLAMLDVIKSKKTALITCLILLQFIFLFHTLDNLLAVQHIGDLFYSLCYFLPLLASVAYLYIEYAGEEKPFRFEKTYCLPEMIFYSLFSFGVIKLFWYRAMIRKLNYLSGKPEKGTVKEIVCLTFVPFYSLYWMFTRSNTLYRQAGKSVENLNDPSIAALLLDLCFFNVMACGLVQGELNKIVSNPAECLSPSISKAQRLLDSLLLLREDGLLTEEEFQKKKLYLSNK